VSKIDYNIRTKLFIKKSIVDGDVLRDVDVGGDVDEDVLS